MSKRVKLEYLDYIIKDRGFNRKTFGEALIETDIKDKGQYISKRILGYSPFEIDEVRKSAVILNLSDAELRKCFNL